MSRLAAVNTEGLLDLVLVAPIAAIAVSLAFALALRGTAKASETARAGGGSSAFAWGVLAVVASLTVLAAIVFGIGVIVTKD